MTDRDSNIAKPAKDKRGLALDTPSETAKTGLPTTGEGAAARDYLQDAAPRAGQAQPKAGHDRKGR